MSRVHDALRRAEQMLESGGLDALPPGNDARALTLTEEGRLAESGPLDIPNGNNNPGGLVKSDSRQMDVDWRNFLTRCKVIPFQPAPETHLIDIEQPHQVPAEEFRSLRTRLNHLQSQQDLHSIVVTSASPAEGKTFTAVNMALAHAQLETAVLLADLDLRRPTVHNLLQSERSPGFSDFLLAQRPLEDCIRRIGTTNLYFMPAGSPVKNPLEILNMRHVKQTLEGFRKIFNWIVLDTPPLLFSADANLLSTMTDGTIIVVRIGSTTYDNVIRAMQTLCENNVLGIVANGARAGELYSKYTYYYSKPEEEVGFDEPVDEDSDDYEDSDNAPTARQTLAGGSAVGGGMDDAPINPVPPKPKKKFGLFGRKAAKPVNADAAEGDGDYDESEDDDSDESPVSKQAFAAAPGVETETSPAPPKAKKSFGFFGRKAAKPVAEASGNEADDDEDDDDEP